MLLKVMASTWFAGLCESKLKVVFMVDIEPKVVGVNTYGLLTLLMRILVRRLTVVAPKMFVWKIQNCANFNELV